MRQLLMVLIFSLAANAATADGGTPLDSLRRGIDSGLQVLNAPRYRDGAHREEQRRMLGAILEQLFDFREFSRRVLASNWHRFTAAQKEVFVAVFTDFLSKYYIGRLQERYRDESVIYTGQKIESRARALVNVAVLWRGQQVPVEVRMIRRGGQWKIYDIQVVGISAVGFYRAQFDSLLGKETPAQVIERIKKHIREIE